MQIYNDADYPNTDYVKYLFKKNFSQINPILFSYYFDIVVESYKGYFGEWEEFYYFVYYDIESKLKNKIYNDTIKLDKITKHLVVKKFIRKFITYCVYRPGGSGYLLAKTHFYSLYNSLKYKILTK